jgi:UDP-perosamine 4-acetyltransferase
MKEEIVVLGTGGHALVVVDILEAMGEYKIRGIISKTVLNTSNFRGYPILGDDSVLPDLLKSGVRYAAIGVGGFKDNRRRKEVYEKVKTLAFELAAVIHPSATISRTAHLGQGVVIFPNVCINTKVDIGNNVIVATGSTIDHETQIADHVLISAGVTVGASVLVQEGALLALGSKVVSGAKIGENVLIGAGAVVTSDCIEEGTYLGIPARRIIG